MPQAEKQKILEVDRIQSDRIYTTADIISLLHVSKETVTDWYRIGLEFTPVSLHPRAKRFVMGEQLIGFLRAYGLALRIISLRGLSNGEEIEEEETEG